MKVKHITLIGLKSCGKSTIGKALAERLQIKFIDTDVVIEANYLAQMKKHASFREIYQLLGEKKFCGLEEVAIQQTVASNEALVIATGGSSMLNKTNADQLSKNTQMIYLQASRETLKQRWQDNPPGFINIDQFTKEFNQYYQARAMFYQTLTDLVVGIDEKTVDDIVKDIIKIISPVTHRNL